MQNQLKMARLQSPNAPSLGDIVVIKDNPSRGCWKKGKIVIFFKSGDGQIRSAKVKLSPAKLLNRPINLLYSIEVSDKDSDTKEDLQKNFPTSLKRPVRSSGIRAKLMIKAQF